MKSKVSYKNRIQFLKELGTIQKRFCKKLDNEQDDGMTELPTRVQRQSIRVVTPENVLLEEKTAITELENSVSNVLQEILNSEVIPDPFGDLYDNLNQTISISNIFNIV